MQSIGGLPSKEQIALAYKILERFESDTDEVEFSEEQLAQLEARMTDPNPQYVSREAWNATLRKYNSDL